MERLPHLGEQGAAALLLRGMDRKDTGSAIKKQVTPKNQALGEMLGFLFCYFHP